MKNAKGTARIKTQSETAFIGEKNETKVTPKANTVTKKNQDFITILDLYFVNKKIINIAKINEKIIEIVYSKIFAVISFLIMAVLLSAGFIMQNSTMENLGTILLGFNIAIFLNSKFGIKSLLRKNAIQK